MLCGAVADLTYDTGERTGDDGKTTQVTWLESSVLTGRSLTVVPVTDDNPPDALGLVVTCGSWDSVVLAGGEVLDLVGLTVVGVDGTDQHVVGNVVQVTSVLQPWTCAFCQLNENIIPSEESLTGHRDVISGSLALGLDQDWEVCGVLTVPSGEWLEDLKTVGAWRDGNVDGGTVLWRSLVGVTTRVVSVGWKTITSWGLELELLTILVLEGVGERVEV